MAGKVFLVGSGPGDPELLTLKAQRLIREADILIYDYLANPRHLLHAKKDAVKIGVGKGFRHKRLSQEKINKLILDAAKNNKMVVRLKGGDPYLFGRGAEEALYLAERGVVFQVVPGVTSATACGAYAGIPLTHRDHNSTVTFLTGHKAEDDNLDSIDWKKIVSIGGTLVIYMGLYNLSVIAKRLVAAGMPASTPAAVVEWGTLPNQKSCDGPLSGIAALASSANLKPPAIIIIGSVAALRKKLNWYEKLPLFGKKVVVTRMREGAGALSARLEALGAEVVELPVIEIQAPASYLKVDDAIRELPTFDWVVFTSAYGVKHFFERLLNQKKDSRIFKRSLVACVGPETAKALAERGIVPDLCPDRFETAALVEVFSRRYYNMKGKNVLLLRSQIAPPALEEGLKKLGANIHKVVAYQTVLPKKEAAAYKKRLLSEKMDFVTFTSSSTVDNFINIVGLPNVKILAKTTKFASIGPVTSATLRRYGFRPFCEAKKFTIEGLIQAMSQPS